MRRKVTANSSPTLHIKPCSGVVLETHAWAWNCCCGGNELMTFPKTAVLGDRQGWTRLGEEKKGRAKLWQGKYGEAICYTRVRRRHEARMPTKIRHALQTSSIAHRRPSAQTQASREKVTRDSQARLEYHHMAHIAAFTVRGAHRRGTATNLSRNSTVPQPETLHTRTASYTRDLYLRQLDRNGQQPLNHSRNSGRG